MRAQRMMVLLGFAAIALAGAPARGEDVKIGIVDLDQALVSTEEGKAARGELERKLKEAQGQVEPLVERFRSMQEELKSKKFVLSEDALRQKNLDLYELGNQIDSKQKELEGKLKIEQERIVGPLQKRLVEIVQQLGKEQGFTVIMARGSPGLVYTREAIDITDLVIQKFNQKG